MALNFLNALKIE